MRLQIVTVLLHIKLIRVFPLFCSVSGDSSKNATEVLTAHVKEISLPDNPDDPHQLITVRRCGVLPARGHQCCARD